MKAEICDGAALGGRNFEAWLHPTRNERDDDQSEIPAKNSKDAPNRSRALYTYPMDSGS
jgi:hypothetical protein